MDKKKYSTLNVQKYKKYLIEDLKEKPAYAELVNKLFFPTSGSILSWLDQILGDNFRSVKPSVYADASIKMCNTEQISKIEWQYESIPKIQDNQYQFFSKIECDTYEDAKNKFPGSYYIFSKDFFAKVNNLFFSTFSDFEQDTSQKSIFSKQLMDGIKIKFTASTQYLPTSEVFEYIYPVLSIEINGQEQFFFNQTDLRSFLLLPGKTFTFFYLESHDILFDNLGKLNRVERKRDEPVIYESLNTGGFMITNSYSKLNLYNKYVLISMDLFKYYYNLFECWFKAQLSNL